ncbi:M20/M25/M40 family metallo-hydrolase [Kutzneria sp. CA-103260]|uniref:M20/M25/M40 family metallo-hydrolase n=1 Tax=Kutzneria sp. CA-103260 TaxID=2802641 RepID=UPI001BA79412|nr:M20/M25/M40 family metallo-hydrolase [Kutzneria sp. CA-103260]QUQ71762.1 dipeptidase [Kutzneria sp. CA-103260]
MKAALAYAHRNRGRFVEEIAELAAIPSVSSDRPQARRAATWLAARLRRAGLGVRIVDTPGNPLVVGGWGRRPDRPTVVLYGHYDVRPAGDLRQWRTPPFQPVVHNGFMLGRGVSDDKGQLLAHVAAVESWLRGGGTLPVNVRLLLDGEEEVGSPHLAGFLDRWGVTPSVAVISDTAMHSPSVPALTVSLRGVVRLAVTVRRPGTDLHSGTYGGRVVDPGRQLCRLIASLRVHGTSMTISRLRAGRGDGVLAAEASARLEFRLSPGVSPDAVIRSLRRSVAGVEGASARVVLARPPVRVPRTGWAIDAARVASRHGFGHEPVFQGSGGGIAAAGLFADRGIPVLLLGFAVPDNRMHAPNERLSLAAFARSVDTCIALLPALADRRPPAPPHRQAARLTPALSPRDRSAAPVPGLSPDFDRRTRRNPPRAPTRRSKSG